MTTPPVQGRQPPVASLPIPPYPGKRQIADPPVTMEFIAVEIPPWYELALHAWLELDPDTARPILVYTNMTSDNWGRTLHLDEIVADTWGHFEAYTYPRRRHVIVRHTEEDDAIGAGISDLPLPIDVIAARLGGWERMSDDLSAIVGEDGYVRTLLLNSVVGLYCRYSGAWIGLGDSSLLDGYYTVPVRGTAVDLYDPYDQAGQSVHIAAMPLQSLDDLIGWVPGARPEDREPTLAEPPPEGTVEVAPTVAAAEPLVDISAADEPVNLPMIETARDLPGAIEIANENPRYRWYVEKRIEALEVEIAVPWANEDADDEEEGDDEIEQPES